MRILLIAPSMDGVSWAQEAAQIARNYQVVPIMGDVTPDRLISATSGESFTVIHIAAHADDRGVELGDWLMTPDQLAAIARHVGAELVFLNTCRSLYLPQYLVDQHVPAVISHSRPVLDHDALRLAAYYYEELERKGGSYYQAYQAVTPRNGTLAWHSNGAYVEPRLEPILVELERVRGAVVQRDRRWVLLVTFNVLWLVINAVLWWLVIRGVG